MKNQITRIAITIASLMPALSWASESTSALATRSTGSIPPAVYSQSYSSPSSSSASSSMSISRSTIAPSDVSSASASSSASAPTSHSMAIGSTSSSSSAAPAMPASRRAYPRPASASLARAPFDFDAARGAMRTFSNTVAAGARGFVRSIDPLAGVQKRIVQSEEKLMAHFVAATDVNALHTNQLLELQEAQRIYETAFGPILGEPNVKRLAKIKEYRAEVRHLLALKQNPRSAAAPSASAAMVPQFDGMHPQSIDARIRTLVELIKDEETALATGADNRGDLAVVQDQNDNEIDADEELKLDAAAIEDQQGIERHNRVYQEWVAAQKRADAIEADQKARAAQEAARLEREVQDNAAAIARQRQADIDAANQHQADVDQAQRQADADQIQRQADDNARAQRQAAAQPIRTQATDDLRAAQIALGVAQNADYRAGLELITMEQPQQFASRTLAATQRDLDAEIEAAAIGRVNNQAEIDRLTALLEQHQEELNLANKLIALYNAQKNEALAQEAEAQAKIALAQLKLDQANAIENQNEAAQQRLADAVARAQEATTQATAQITTCAGATTTAKAESDGAANKVITINAKKERKKQRKIEEDKKEQDAKIKAAIEAGIKQHETNEANAAAERNAYRWNIAKKVGIGTAVIGGVTLGAYLIWRHYHPTSPISPGPGPLSPVQQQIDDLLKKILGLEQKQELTQEQNDALQAEIKKLQDKLQKTKTKPVTKPEPKADEQTNQTQDNSQEPLVIDHGGLSKPVTAEEFNTLLEKQKPLADTRQKIYENLKAGIDQTAEIEALRQAEQELTPEYDTFINSNPEPADERAGTYKEFVKAWHDRAPIWNGWIDEKQAKLKQPEPVVKKEKPADKKPGGETTPDGETTSVSGKKAKPGYKKPDWVNETTSKPKSKSEKQADKKAKEKALKQSVNEKLTEWSQELANEPKIVDKATKKAAEEASDARMKKYYGMSKFYQEGDYLMAAEMDYRIKMGFDKVEDKSFMKKVLVTVTSFVAAFFGIRGAGNAFENQNNAAAPVVDEPQYVYWKGEKYPAPRPVHPK